MAQDTKYTSLRFLIAILPWHQLHPCLVFVPSCLHCIFFYLETWKHFPVEPMAVLLLRITLGNDASQKPFSSPNPILKPKSSPFARHEPGPATQSRCQGAARGWGGSWSEGKSLWCTEGWMRRFGVPAGPRRGGSRASALSSLPSVSLSAWAALVQQVAAGQVAEQSHPSQSTHPNPPRWPGAGSPSLLRPREGRAAGRTEDPDWGPGRAPQRGEPHRRRRRRRRGRAAAQDRQQSARQQGQPAEVTARCRRRAAEAGSREEGTAASREELRRRRAPLPQRGGATAEPRLPWKRRCGGAQGPARRRRLQSGAPPGAPLSRRWWEASGPRAEQNGAQIQGVHRDRVFILIILLRLRLWVGAGGAPAAQGASGSRAWAAGCQGRGDRHRQQTPRRLQCLWLY